MHKNVYIQAAEKGLVLSALRGAGLGLNMLLYRQGEAIQNLNIFFIIRRRLANFSPQSYG